MTPTLTLRDPRGLLSKAEAWSKLDAHSTAPAPKATAAQLRVLTPLAKYGPLSPDDISHFARCWTAHLIADVDECHRLGWLEIWCEGDTQAQTIYKLTPAGKEVAR